MPQLTSTILLLTPLQHSKVGGVTFTPLLIHICPTWPFFQDSGAATNLCMLPSPHITAGGASFRMMHTITGQNSSLCHTRPSTSAARLVQKPHRTRLKGTGCGVSNVSILTRSDIRSPTRPS